MTEFIYRRVEDGEGILMPELKEEVESLFTDHINRVHELLTHYDLVGWTVIFQPHKDGQKGLLHRPLRQILVSITSGEDMIATLLHEIHHWNNPTSGYPDLPLFHYADESLAEWFALKELGKWLREEAQDE